MSAHVLMKLGPPFEKLEDAASRAIGLANRLSHPKPFRDRIGQPGERNQQDQHRRDRDLIVDDDVVAQQPQRDRQPGPIEQAGARVEGQAGDDPPRIGLLVPIEVLVEPLAVVLADAINPDRAQQAQIFVEQAKLDRRVAKRDLVRLSSVAVQDPCDQPDEEAQRRQENGQERRDQESDHQQAGRQDVNPRGEVEVGDQAVADVVDLSRPQVDHRADALGRQRRLAQPVHLAVNLPAERRRNVGRDPWRSPSPPDRHERDQHDTDQPQPQQRRQRAHVAAQAGQDARSSPRDRARRQR